jgi:uncharacterized protein
VRTCPVCTIALIEMTLKHEEIDRCPSCNGIFFDQGKLKSVLRIVELLEHAELEEADIENLSPLEQARRLACPADGTIMVKRDFGAAVLDACPACGGFWLDGGEIAALKQVETHVKANLSLYVRLGRGQAE